MPKDPTELLLELAWEAPESDRLGVQFSLEGGRVLRFVVQYETRLADKYVPVVRYDTAHGTPHRDLLDINGNSLEKTDLDLTNEEALSLGWNDLTKNWRSYRAAFRASSREHS